MIIRIMLLLPIWLGLGAVAAAEEAKPAEGGEPIANWSGLYAGLHGGYGRSRTQWVFPFAEYYNLVQGDRFSIKPEGALAGGHLLVNRQFGPIVAGVEAAYSRGTLSAARIGPVTPFFPLDRFQTDIDDMAAISGRLGYAFDRWQVYAKAGWANAEISHHALSGPPGAGVVAVVGGRRNGHVLGGGVEYSLTPEIALGIQYDFARFGAERQATMTTGVPPSQPFTLDADDVDLHSITARLSWRLGDACDLLEAAGR